MAPFISLSFTLSSTRTELPDDYKYSNFCAASDLRSTLDDVFVIEDNMAGKMVYVKLDRWKQLIGLPESLGISADRLYVLPDKQIERNPLASIEPNAN